MATFALFTQIGPYHVSGVLQTNIKVYHYAAGTTTLQDVWTDRAKTTTAAQPVASDGNGIVSFYADGLYKLVIKYGAAETTLYTYDNVQYIDVTTVSGEGAAIASASPLVLGSDGNFFHVTGTTGFSAISASTLPSVILAFDGALTMTHGSSLLLANAENYTTTAGDVFYFVNEGAGIFREVARKVAARTSNRYSETLNAIENLSVDAEASSNTLIVSLKTRSGGTPSTTDAGYIAFRSATIATEGYTVRSVTAALSVTLSNGSTLGTLASSYVRLYVLALDNAGTVELAVYNPLNPSGSLEVSSLLGLDLHGIVSSVAEGGAGGADTTQIVYSTTARTNVAYRLIGYVDVQTGVAGAWSNQPLRVATITPATPITGAIVQTKRTFSGAVATGTTAIPDDDTIPQIAEGDQYYTLTVTPKMAGSIFRVVANLNVAHSADQQICVALFLNAGANAVAATRIQPAGNDQVNQAHLEFYHYPGAVSNQVYDIRAGSSTGATLTVNGEAGARKLGGVLISSLTVEEICG